MFAVSALAGKAESREAGEEALMLCHPSMASISPKHYLLSH